MGDGPPTACDRDSTCSPRRCGSASSAADWEAAIRQVGERARRRRRGAPGVRGPMLEREQSISTFVGEGVAIPHGTFAGKDLVSATPSRSCSFLTGSTGTASGSRCASASPQSATATSPILAQLAEILMDAGSCRSAANGATTAEEVFDTPDPETRLRRQHESRPLPRARRHPPRRRAPSPSAGPGDVVIRVRNCSTCGTDVKISRHGHQHIEPPRTMGHEIAGEIVELGSDVDGWTVGDRVQVIAAIPCGICPDCRAGRMTICPNQTSMGYHFDGAFATVLPGAGRRCSPSTGSTASPRRVSFAEASVAEPLACVINGQQLARVGDGDDVVDPRCRPDRLPARSSGPGQRRQARVPARPQRRSTGRSASGSSHPTP